MAKRWTLIPAIAALLLAFSLQAAPGKYDRDMWEAAIIGDTATMEELLDKGVDPNAANRYGKSALMFAAEEGNEEVVELLIRKGVDVNRRSVAGCTALTFAAENGNANIVKMLLAQGAKVHPKTRAGWDAVMIATRYNKLESCPADFAWR